MYLGRPHPGMSTCSVDKKTRLNAGSYLWVGRYHRLLPRQSAGCTGGSGSVRPKLLEAC